MGKNEGKKDGSGKNDGKVKKVKLKKGERKAKKGDPQPSRCPCCRKSCPLAKPKCGKGRKLAEKLGVR